MENLTKEEVKTIRKNLGMTQKGLGNAIGYSEAMVRHVEKGRKLIQNRFSIAVKQLKDNNHYKCDHGSN